MSGDDTTTNLTSSTTENPLLRPSNPLVSDLEQEVLDEYTRLLENVNKLSDKLADLSGNPSSMTLDGLRLLERKTATVCTLLKASVYSIVLQQQIYNDEENNEVGEDGGVGVAGGYEGDGYTMGMGDVTMS